jgi:hypothetical protein
MPSLTYKVRRSRRAFVNAPKVRAIMQAALEDKAAPHFVNEFEKRVSNWEHKPDIKTSDSHTPARLSVTIFPSGRHLLIYTYVTKGTKAHPIPLSPKSRGWLAFMWGGPGSYKPKTTPGGGYGGPGIVSGGKMTFRKQVHHPGFKGRHFEKDIRKKNKAWFSRTMKNAWRRAIRAMSSG